jgi:hypothetical protein
LDDVVDDDDNESLLGLSKNNKTGVQNNIFTIKESNDKGLADMETGSEVYMSELLVSVMFIFMIIRLDSIWKTLMRQRR